MEPPEVIEVCYTTKTSLKLDNEGKVQLNLGLHEVGNWTSSELIYRLCYLFADQAQISEYRSLRVLDRLIRWWDESAYGYDFVDLRIKTQFGSEVERKQNVFISVVAKPFAILCWFGVTACKKLYQFFRYLTRSLCGGMMRQISDASEELACKAVGSRNVESYFVKQAYMSPMIPIALHHFRASFERSSEVKDFSEFVRSVQNTLGEIESEIEDEFKKQKTLKTDLDRRPRVIIKKAKALAEPGLYRKESKSPAAFLDFGAISRRSTRDLKNDLLL